jgi:transcription-repair coupling factor (superfamily II helicase)
MNKDLVKFIKDNPTNHTRVFIFPEYTNLEIENENIDVFPDYDTFPFEEIDISSKIKKQRLNIMYKLKKGEKINLVTSLHSLTRFTIPPNNFIINYFKKGDIFKDNLYEIGYKSNFEISESSEYSKRGFIRDLFIPIYEYPVRLELFDDEIDRLNFFDPLTQKSIKKIDYFELVPGSEVYYDESNIKLMNERLKIEMKKFKEIEDLNIDMLNYFPSLFHKDKATLLSYLPKDTEFIIIEKDRIVKTFTEKERENIEMSGSRVKKSIYKKYSGMNIQILDVLKYRELDIKLKKKKIKKNEDKDNSLEYIPLLDWEDLKEDDLIVHDDYGIGIFKGVKIKSTPIGEREYITIEYTNKSKIFVPVERLDKISKYIGDKSKIRISSLNGKKWEKTKKEVEKKVHEKVKKILEIYALRENKKGKIIKGDKELEKKLQETFPYVETNDQIKSIEDINSDLMSNKPMDRLLVGDAGFGKTEVALRAAFKTIIDNYQVLFLAPTTILSQQHYETFVERLDSFGVNIKLLNRHVTPKERNEIIKKASLGEVDILIGTHTLLSEKIKIKKLGLVIIDEEQRFGVLQKERLKELELGVNFLMMSATPIPRTLYMSISGLREISTISTPPFGRMPIQTYIGSYSDRIVRIAALREKSRGGQILYVHNRINGLKKIYEKLKILIPEIKIEYLHGRTNKIEFNNKINRFYNNEIDMLVTTSIIENGVDIPNVNTIIIDDSQRYGISQLYQLKGRVGRSKRRAFAYFLYKESLTNDSKMRLEAMKKFNEPGSGLKLALRDLEIRGYGDVLGVDQKGHINSVGLHLYKEILEETVNKMTGKGTINKKQKIYTEIKGLKGSLLIPENYIGNSIERMRIYRRISLLTDLEELNELYKEIEDRFGKMPEELINLFDYAKVRIKASYKGIKQIEIGDNYVKLIFNENIVPKKDDFDFKVKRVNLDLKTNEMFVYGIKDFKNYFNRILNIGEKENV